MRRPSIRKTALTTAAMLALAVYGYVEWRCSAISSAAWESQIAAAAESEAADVLHAAAISGEAGVRAVVAALGDQREPVRRGAERELQARLDDWELQRPDKTRRLLATVASELARRCDSWPDERRGLAVDIAMRLLLWPTSAASISDDSLVLDCERILQSCGDSAALARQRNPRGEPKLAQPARVAARLDEPPRFPPLPAAAPMNFTPQLAGEPRKLTPDTTAAPLVEQSAAVASPASEPAGEANLPAVLSSVDDVTPAASGILTQATRVLPPLQSASVVELFRLRRGSDPLTADAINAEFRRRGFTNAQIAAGESLTDPDPEVRRLGVIALPATAGLDAKPWLLWASRDDHATVRLAAVEVMGTSTEAEMLRRIEEMSRTDDDPSVRQQAARVVRGRTGR